VKAVEDRLLALVREYSPRGVQFAGICSNDAVTYPEDAFDRLRERCEFKAYGFPYLHDESQAVAHAFDAVCTPDIFVYDGDRRLAYRGRIDDSWKDPAKVTRRELAEAIDALLTGKRPSAEQHPSWAVPSSGSRTSSARQNFSHVWVVDASRPASLLLGYIRPVCALVAPRRPGASAAET